MKNRIRTLLSGLILLFSMPTLAQIQNDHLGRDMNHVAVFKRPLVIPYDTLKPDGEKQTLRHSIEKSGAGTHDNYIAITIIDGEVIQTTEMFPSRNPTVSSYFDIVSKKREHSMPFGTFNEDLSYCVVYVNASKLQRDDATRQYVFFPREEMTPFIEPSLRKSFNVNSGTVTEETFGMYVELKPSERPNESTQIGRSNEIAMFTCYRYAAKNYGMQVGDFVQVFGKENIEMRIK